MYIQTILLSHRGDNVKEVMLKLNEILIYIMLVIINSQISFLDEPLSLLIIYLYIYNHKKLVYIFLLVLLLICDYIVFMKFVILISLFNFVLQILKLMHYNNLKIINIYSSVLFVYLIFTKVCEKLDFLYVDLINIFIILIIINIAYSCIMSVEKRYKQSFLLALDRIFR